MTTTDVRPDVDGQAAHARRPFRPDIDGLRAVAILGVLLFHAEVPFMAGGFVGVDVFFVISGFLITSHLVWPAGNEHRDLLGFWGRRIRRLLPAMAVMTIVTVALMLLFLAPSDAVQWSRWTASAALYVPNVALAAGAGDYFGGVMQESPFLHTWSLGVEEQFYFLWPLILLVVTLARPADRRRSIAVAIGVIFAASLALAIWLTATESPWAFYGPQARAWQFATGGMLATLVPRAPSPRLASVVTTGGLVAIVASFLLIDEAGYPGLWALIPTAATAALLWAGGTARPSSRRLLTAAPTQWLGRLSYSLYLYHWPFMVILPIALHRNTVPVRLAAGVLAVPVAMISLRWVENPVRRSPRLAASTPKTFALGVGLTTMSLLAAASLHVVGQHRGQQEPYRSWEASRQDWRDPECAASMSPSGVAYCASGAASADRSLLLVGDSHAEQWMRTISAAGRSNGASVILRALGNCTPIVPLRDAGEELTADCLAGQRDTAKLIDELDPDAVVMVEAASSRDSVGTPKDWEASAIAQVERLRREGRQVGLIRTVPRGGDPLLCLARRGSESDCTPDLEIMDTIVPYRAAERRVREMGVPVLDVVPDICDDDGCNLRFGADWVYGLRGHLTRSFTAAHRNDAIAFVAEVLG